MNRVMIAGLVFIAFAAAAADEDERAGVVTVANVDVLYRSAVDNARAGHYESALAMLRLLLQRSPGRQDIVGDYAVVLGWAGDHRAALDLLDRIDRAHAPAHVIEGLANSARRMQRYDLAEALYGEAQLRFPGRVEAKIGLVRTLLDAGKLDAAAVMVKDLRVRFPRHPDVLHAYAEVATAQRDYFAALEAYQAVLAMDPADSIAVRGKIQTLSRLGAPQLAIELADRHPGVLAAGEHDAIAADRTAHQIRWGAIVADTGLGPLRFAGIDLALADSEAAGLRALDPLAVLSATERQLALDRIGALRERFRMRDAVTLYEAIAARPAPVPAYAMSAAASAYLYLEQPEKARDLYREALISDPENLESRIGLFYALAESEAHDAALAEIEHAVEITPQWIDAWSPATVRENPAYARVLAARAMAPLLANRPGEAEQRMHALSDRAPYNMDIRTDYASSMRARGWPRMAEQELRWILAVDPVNSGALGEHAGTLLELNDYRKAEAALAVANTVAAEDGRVVRAARLWQVHNMRELIVDGTFGRSGGGPSGTQDHALDMRLYSSPFDYNYRAFAHGYYAEARFENGTGQRKRLGAGLEYRSPEFVVTGELAHDTSNDKTSASASLAYSPDDYWTLRGEYDTSANQTPLQASLAGIDARRAAGEVVWRANESRSAALSVEQMDFSDGNRRNVALARWTERVIAGPVYKLEITGALYASHNSAGNTPYFNPSNDFSPTVEFANEWLQWRRYTRAFRHRLVASAGDYRQEGFGSAPVYGVRYEQEWEADDRLTFRYGIGRSLHPYDGVQTARNYGYFYLNGKF